MTTVLPGKINVELYPHQEKVINQLKTGSILYGGVGSGKSITALMYYYKTVPFCTDLYIITTARKRDTKDWEKEYKRFNLSDVVVDSWNNIKKYINVKNSFFIFDEQRLVGSGAWVKTFLKIVKSNDWILLSATPGDTWMDYIPVFIANGFYKNRTAFIREHVVYNTFVKFPKVDRYVDEAHLYKLRKKILVSMDYKRKTVSLYKNLFADYDKDKFKLVVDERWNPYTDKPIKDISELCFTMRRVVNSDPSRLNLVRHMIDKHKKLVVFYNFNYELELLRQIEKLHKVPVNEYNGHKHEPVPEGNNWVYLVQYMSGGEGWNCIETNTIVFYSLNYSYRMMTQAAGRIDRLNTPFKTLFYYRIVSKSLIDGAIRKSLTNKKNFNEKSFVKTTLHVMEESELV